MLIQFHRNTSIFFPDDQIHSEKTEMSKLFHELHSNLTCYNMFNIQTLSENTVCLIAELDLYTFSLVAWRLCACVLAIVLIL